MFAFVTSNSTNLLSVMLIIIVQYGSVKDFLETSVTLRATLAVSYHHELPKDTIIVHDKFGFTMGLCNTLLRHRIAIP